MGNFIKWVLLSIFSIPSVHFLHAQDYQRATSETHSEPYFTVPTVVNSTNAIDSGSDGRGNLSTFANIMANSGLLGGIGEYDGFLELSFPDNVPANNTTYLKIDSDQDQLLDNLLGGSEVADVLGGVILGNQIISVQVFNNSATVLSGSSDDDFGSTSLLLVSNENNEYFIAITPNQNYNRIRITQDFNSLLGLTSTAQIQVAGAYYNTLSSPCDSGRYTSWRAEGGVLNADLTGTGGVNNPGNVIDTVEDNYSELVIPTIATAGNLQQTIYFEGAGTSSETYQIALSSTADVLTLGLSDQIEISGYNGNQLVNSTTLSELLDLDLLALFENNEIINFPYTPGGAIDRITIQLSALANVSLISSLRLYNIAKNPPKINTLGTLGIQSTLATLAASLENSNCINGIYGFEYSTNPDFAQGTGTFVAANNLNNGEFSATITGLTPQETYYYRALAESNSGGVTYNSYGGVESFSTLIITWDGDSWNNIDGPSGDGTQDIRLAADYNTIQVGEGFSANNFYIDPETTLTLSNSYPVTIYGNIDAENEAIDASNGIVLFQGDNPQIIDGNNYIDQTISKIAVNKDDNTNLSFLNNVNITESLSVTNGDLTIEDGANLTFISSLEKTASFGQVIDCGNTEITYIGSGIVTVERFIPAGLTNRRAFRALTAPVNSSTSIRDNWQEGVNNTVPALSENKNPNPGYGTHITGPQPTINGFDATQTQNPSLFKYNLTAQTLQAIDNTNTNTFEIGEGYFILIRGDRSTNTEINSPIPTNTVLRASGQLHLCDFDFSAQLSNLAGNFNFIGNPYQSPIDMSLVLNDSSTQNLNNQSFLVYDPNINTTGGYVTVNLATGTTTPSVSEATQYLHAGQACFVLNDSDGGNANLVIKEDHKSTIDENLQAFRLGASQNQEIAIDLYTVLKSDHPKLMDGVKLSFDPYSSNIPKFPNSGNNLSIREYDKQYTLLNAELPSQEKSVIFNLQLENPEFTKYYLDILPKNLEGYDIALINLQTQEVTPIKSSEGRYSFEVSSSKNKVNYMLKLEASNRSSIPEKMNNAVSGEFVVSPNPIKDNVLYLSGDFSYKEEVSLSLYNLLGQKLQEIKVIPSSKTVRVNLSPSCISNGVYLLQAKTSKGEFSQKLIIE